MKPRTRLEKLVAGLSEKLPAITKAQEEWAKEHVFGHVAYKCKDELWCSECGGMWVNASESDLGDKTECPYCHHRLDIKVSRKRKVHEEDYMSILQVRGGFQVIRHILYWKNVRKGASLVHYDFMEVAQEWIGENGKRTIMAIPMNMGGNGWIYGSPLSIKGEYGSCNYRADMYAIWGELYPRKELLPELKRRGLGKRFPDVNIVISPLESITQFYQEGKAMRHCVYKLKYYNIADCLILSAKDTGGKRIETIEVSLKTMDIVQSRAVCNGVSKYHDQIVRLVKENMNLIRQKTIA